jgi:hypothetical protein
VTATLAIEPVVAGGAGSIALAAFLLVAFLGTTTLGKAAFKGARRGATSGAVGAVKKQWKAARARTKKGRATAAKLAEQVADAKGKTSGGGKGKAAAGADAAVKVTPRTKPQSVAHYGGVAVRGTWSGFRKGSKASEQGINRFRNWSHPKVAATLKNWAAKTKAEGLGRLLTALSNAYGETVAPAPAAATPSATPATPTTTPAATPAATTAKPTTPATPATPPNNVHQLFQPQGAQTVADIQVPSKLVDNAIQAVVPIADFLPNPDGGGAWELDEFLKSFPEFLRTVSTALAFVASNLDKQNWDPAIIHPLYAASKDTVSASVLVMNAAEQLRTVYKPDFDAAETGGRRIVTEHGKMFDPRRASA